MEKEELDKAYGKELDKLYVIAVKNEELGAAIMLLDKKRNLDLYMLRGEDDTAV